MIHLAGKFALPVCDLGATKAQTSYDKSKVTCKRCWDVILRKASGKKPKKHKPGLRQSVTPKLSPARIIMRDGIVVAHKRFKKVLPAIESAHQQIESRLSPKQTKGSLVGSVPPLGSGSVPTDSPTPTARTVPGERIG